jgi:site-specific recombinase XerC
MTLIAPHIAAFLQQRLPVERQASPNTCDSYAHAFRLLFEYASSCLKITPSQLQVEHIDAPLIVAFLNHLEATRGNGAGSRNIRLAAIKSFMRYIEYRLPSALEQIRCILSIPTKKTDEVLPGEGAVICDQDATSHFADTFPSQRTSLTRPSMQPPRQVVVCYRTERARLYLRRSVD